MASIPTTPPPHDNANPKHDVRLPRDVHDPTFDWTAWHLIEEEDVGQSPEQMVCIELLTSITRQWVEEKGWDHLWVGTDIFMGWKQDDPQVMLSPDVLIAQPAPDMFQHKSIQTWRPGHEPPLWAVEVVSDSNKSKDYQINPAKYDQLGTLELVMFDPRAAWRAIREKVRGKRRPGRPFLHHPIELYRRNAQGRLVQTEDTGREPVYSEVLEAWLVIVPAADTDGARLRIARDPEGQDLVPTLAEARAQTEADALRERQERERAEAEALHERQERERAEAEALRERQERERAEDALLQERQEQEAIAKQLAELLGSEADPAVQALLAKLHTQS